MIIIWIIIHSVEFIAHYTTQPKYSTWLSTTYKKRDFLTFHVFLIQSTQLIDSQRFMSNLHGLQKFRQKKFFRVARGFSRSSKPTPPHPFATCNRLKFRRVTSTQRTSRDLCNIFTLFPANSLQNILQIRKYFVSLYRQKGISPV